MGVNIWSNMIESDDNDKEISTSDEQLSIILEVIQSKNSSLKDIWIGYYLLLEFLTKKKQVSNNIEIKNTYQNLYNKLLKMLFIPNARYRDNSNKILIITDEFDQDMTNEICTNIYNVYKLLVAKYKKEVYILYDSSKYVGNSCDNKEELLLNKKDFVKNYDFKDSFSKVNIQMPDISVIQKLIIEIDNMNFQYIIRMGKSDLLADLCSGFLPVINMSDEQFGNLSITPYIAKYDDLVDNLDIVKNILLHYKKRHIEVCEVEKIYEVGLESFDNRNYYKAIECLVTCYKKNYLKDNVMWMINTAYMEQNQKEFENNYYSNISKYKNYIFIDGELPSYSQLKYDFVPVFDGIYYIFNKLKKEFVSKIDFNQLIRQINCNDKYEFDDEFSDVLVENNNIYEFMSIFYSGGNKNFYCLIDYVEIFFSYFKVQEIKLLPKFYIFSKKDIVKAFFHNNTSLILPRNYYGLNKTWFDNFIADEHRYRLTKRGRSTNNVILTIGIPTYNRGHRALDEIERLIKSEYDSEVEIIVSDNCSTENIEGYQQISQINDSRLVYIRNRENYGFEGNIWNILKYSNGKFVVLLSDEDHIVLEAIGHYLKLIKEHPNLSIIRSNNPETDAESYYGYPSIYVQKSEGFIEYFLLGNYLSGIIYNKEICLQEETLEFIKKIKKTKAYEVYPHLCLDAFLLLKGEYCKEKKILFYCGASEIQNYLEKRDIILYQTKESRIQQFWGFIEVLNILDFEDQELKLAAYIHLCYRILDMVKLVRSYYEDIWVTLCEELKEEFLAGFDSLEFNKEVNFEYYIYKVKLLFETI